jgi:hypothetical protein
MDEYIRREIEADIAEQRKHNPALDAALREIEARGLQPVISLVGTYETSQEATLAQKREIREQRRKGNTHLTNKAWKKHKRKR